MIRPSRDSRPQLEVALQFVLGFYDKFGSYHDDLVAVAQRQAASLARQCAAWPLLASIASLFLPPSCFRLRWRRECASLWAGH
jgi:hypothetical protein